MKPLPALLFAFVLLTGCRPAADLHQPRPSATPRAERTGPAAPAIPTPCALILTPHSGETRMDREIIRLQQSIPSVRDAAPYIERLGWMFVSKARSSFDPGYYKLAEQCAACLDERAPDTAEAQLLRGHILQNLHRFKEAEPLARKLVARRGLPYDHGLLGDVLMEQGRLTEAIDAYQQMVNLRPDAQAYARVAHVRWLKGDLEGALEVMRLAVGASTPQAPESAAWISSRLAFYELHAGDLTAARGSCAEALQMQTDYPPALLVRGRILLADGQGAEAVEPLLRAARLNPLPEYQWALSAALRAAGRTAEAEAVERELLKSGAANDPRTFALFLATRGQQPALAVELAERELAERADVHTHDALGWALASAGRWEEARGHSQAALAEGTADARLHLHAGLIAVRLKLHEEAARHLGLARKFRQTLLPDECGHLDAAWREFASTTPLRETASNTLP